MKYASYRFFDRYNVYYDIRNVIRGTDPKFISDVTNNYNITNQLDTIVELLKLQFHQFKLPLCSCT